VKAASEEWVEISRVPAMRKLAVSSHIVLKACTLRGADQEPAARFTSDVMDSHGDPSRPNGIRARADAATSETSMPNPYLPPEMLDDIVDHLHDTEDALRSCSLVSKLWIPRIRKHLFAEVGLRREWDMRLWEKTFPDPGTSPARYTKTLHIGSYVVLAGDVEVGSLLGDFSRVVRLEVGSYEVFVDTSKISFIPFRGFSPVLKSLRVVVPILPSSRIFNLILLFPLLEDLDVIIHKTAADNNDGSEEDEAPTATQPSSPPRFTGSLELYLKGGNGTFRPSTVFPLGRYPLSGPRFDVASRGGSLNDDGIGGGVCSYPRIPRCYLGPLQYVHPAVVSAPITYFCF
jgi:hypothetical protein